MGSTAILANVRTEPFLDDPIFSMLAPMDLVFTFIVLSIVIGSYVSMPQSLALKLMTNNYITFMESSIRI